MAATIGLAQHLAALHHRTSPIGPGHAFPGQIPGLAQIEHVDQVGGVTPRGERLDGGLPFVLVRHGVDHLDTDPIRIERPVIAQRVVFAGRFADHGEDRRLASEAGQVDVLLWEVEHARLAVAVVAEAGVGSGHKVLTEPRLGPVGVALDRHGRGAVRVRNSGWRVTRTSYAAPP